MRIKLIGVMIKTHLLVLSHALQEIPYNQTSIVILPYNPNPQLSHKPQTFYKKQIKQ